MDPLKDDSDATLSSSGCEYSKQKDCELFDKDSQYHSPQNKEDAAGGICVEETNY